MMPSRMVKSRTMKVSADVAGDPDKRIRLVGRVVELMLSEAHGGSLVGFKITYLHLWELADGRADLIGSEKLPPGRKVRAIVYVAADDRSGPGTKGQEMLHLFGEEDGPPEVVPGCPVLERIQDGYRLTGGNYKVGPVGIQG